MAHAITQRQDGSNEVFVAGAPAWHKLGINVQDAVTWREACKLAQLNWKVEKRQLLSPKDKRPVDAWGTFRSDNDYFLGAVGEKFLPTQIEEQFGFVDTLLQSKDGAHYESAGSIFGGKKVWCLARVPDDIRIKGTDDVSKTYLMFLNKTDGSGSDIAKFVSTRVVCWNTIQLALNEGGKEIRIPHVASNQEQKRKALEYLQSTHGVVKNVNALYNMLADIHLDMKTIQQIFLGVFSSLEENSTQQNKAARILELFEDNDGNAFPKIKGSAYAMFNAFTRYTDHHASARVSDDKETDENARARNAMFGIGEVFKFQILQAITHACYRNKPGVISGVELFDVTQEVVFK
jgi:phage/plasmid-like protein (TIGR03299 family)